MFEFTSLYQLVTGPLALLSLIIFFVGLVARVVLYAKDLDWKIDRVTYGVNTMYGIRGALRSIYMWLLPFGTIGWRKNPLITFMFFVFHISLILVPVFLQAHNIILEQKLGFSLWTISDRTADILTIAFMVAAVFLIIRRIALPEVRIMTTAYDYVVLAITVIPFVTGFLAAHNIGDYQFWVITHIIAGEIMLVAIPFTKLSHFVLFFCTRAQLGVDYGIKRGGMKSDFAW